MTTKAYDANVPELQKLKSDGDQTAAEREKSLDERINTLETENATLQKRLEDANDDITKPRSEREGLRKQRQQRQVGAPSRERARRFAPLARARRR